MSWSYSGDPSASDLDECRFYLQDTEQARPLLSDEELQFLIDSWAPVKDSNLYAAAVAAEVLAAKFAAEINVTADGINVDQGSLQDKYEKLAASLRDQYKALYETGGVPSDADMDGSTDYDSSIPPLQFGIGFQDNFEAGRQNYGDRGQYSDGYAYAEGAEVPHP
jgi:hypothetical protein